MTAILLNALAELDRSLQGLETAAGAQVQRSAAMRQQHQQDLFNSSAAARTGGSVNGMSIPPEMIAVKLDSAISRIEQILAEG